ncbi:MAG: T9SS type A sorting domain-containing protein [Bacteroidota bacterium]
MKKIILFIVGIIVVSQLNAQNTFIRGYSDVPFNSNPQFFISDVQEMQSGEFIFCAPNNLYGNNMLVKTDNNGVPLSAVKLQNVSGTILSPAITEIGESGNNTFYYAGRFQNASFNTDSVFVMRAYGTDSVIWQRAFSNDYLLLRKMLVTSDLGVILLMQSGILAGETFSALVKIANDGTIQWQKFITNVPYFNSGFNAWMSGSTEIFDISETSSGQFLLCGKSTSATTRIGNFITKIDLNGNFVWTKKINTSPFVGFEVPKKIAETANGLIKVVIEQPITAADYNFGILDVNASGGVTGSVAYEDVVASGYNTILDAVVGVSGGINDVTVAIENTLTKVQSAGVVFSYQFSGLSALTRLSEGLSRTADNGYIIPGWYAVNPFTEQIGCLIKTASDGTTTPGYYSPTVFTQVNYVSQDSVGVLEDSIVSLEIPINLHFINTSVSLDTLFLPVTGISENASLKSDIAYPNPADHAVIINHKYTSVDDVQIMNAAGDEIFFIKTDDGQQMSIDVSHFSNGIYFIKIRTKDNISTQKLIIQH